MRIRFIQQIIDKLRNKEIDEKNKILKNVERKLLDKSYKIDDELIITNTGVKFYNKNALYEIYEVFEKLDYEFITPPDRKNLVIDIGMNMAASTLYFANMENTIKVYAFEPFLPTYEKARRNIELNPHLADKIMTFNYGLGVEDKVIETNYCEEESGCMSTTHDVFKLNGKFCKSIDSRQKVEIKNTAPVIKSIIDKYKNERLILKVDTEGAEFEIFRSLENADLLKNFDVVMLEYHFQSPKQLEKSLINNNFVVFYSGIHQKNEKVGFIKAVRNAA